MMKQTFGFSAIVLATLLLCACSSNQSTTPADTTSTKASTKTTTQASTQALSSTKSAPKPKKEDRSDTSMNTEALEAYHRFLSADSLNTDCWDSISSSDVEFQILDANQDGTPELFLRYLKAAHAFGISRLFTYTDGKVKEINIYEPIVYPDAGTIMYSYTGSGEWLREYYTIDSKGNPTLFITMYCSDEDYSGEYTVEAVKDSMSSNPEGVFYYYQLEIGGEKHSYEECNRYVEECIGDSQCIDAWSDTKWRENTEKNRTAILGPLEFDKSSSSTDSSSYVIADSDSRLLNEEEIKKLSAEEMRLARNEIFARHGRRFKADDLQKHFDQCDWYQGTVNPDTFDANMSSRLSEIEMKNVRLIQSIENGSGEKSSTNKQLKDGLYYTYKAGSGGDFSSCQISNNTLTLVASLSYFKNAPITDFSAGEALGFGTYNFPLDSNTVFEDIGDAVVEISKEEFLETMDFEDYYDIFVYIKNGIVESCSVEY